MKYEQIEDPEEYLASLLEDEMAAVRHRERTDRDNGGGKPSQLVRMTANVVLGRIKSVGISHDYQDVLDVGVNGVLAFYGIALPLTAETEQVLRADLLVLGAKRQTQEMVRSSSSSDVHSFIWSPYDTRQTQLISFCSE